MASQRPRPKPRSPSSFATVLGMLTGLAQFVLADCECGYSTSIEGNSQLFTDLIESDFAHLPSIESNTDWIRQAFNETSETTRGSYGEMYTVDNMRTLVSSNTKAEDGATKTGQSAGLELTVKAGLIEDMIPVAEIDTNRTDIYYGTYRAGIKLTNVPGTCSAFFWYFNDTQEIDMEFLSKDFNASNNSYPVNLVLQSREAAENGFDAQNTPNFVKVYLSFDPTANFHEYRIDFLQDTVVFYADNKALARMDGGAVPTHAGHLVLQQWSNGNPLWSGGPPKEDSVTTVSYVKAYFNSSLTERQRDWALRCRDTSIPKAVCPIPEVTATNNTPTGWFFSSHRNMSNNQTVSNKDSLGTRPATARLVLVTAVLAVSGWELGIW